MSSGAAQAQIPANDDPCGAVQLSLNGSLCTVPTVGTNVGATTTTVNGTVANTCGSFNNPTPKDVWYKFTTDATGAGSAGATITVTGNPAGLIRLFSAPSCTGTFTQVSCSASNAANTPAPRLVTGALQPNTTYYVQVAGFSSTDTQGQFTICITDPPTCGAPAVLGVTFPTGTSASVAFTAGPGNTAFTVVLQGGAGGQQTVTNATSPTVFSGLTPGTTYFVTVRTECGGNTLQSPFFSFTVPLLNDDPCGAINLPVGATCNPTTGTTFGAGTTTPNGYSNPSCAADLSPMDVWYQFTTPATGGASTSATITVTGFAAGQVRLFSAASCSAPLTQLACSQNPNGPAQPLSYTSLTPNTTYYVLVAGYSDTSPRGAFTICVTGAPACPDPLNLAISGVNATTASLSFTPSGNATSYIVTYTAAGGPTTTVTPAPTGSPVALTGLLANTTYTVTLQSVCPAGVGSVLTRTYTNLGGAPANDECVGATPITSIGIGTCGALVPGSVGAATSSVGAPAPGCAGFQATTADIWYSLTVPANGVLQVETGPGATNSVNDTGLALYSGSCGSLTLLGCDDDASPNGNFSLLRRTGLTPGSTVYVRVWKFGATAGSELTVCATTDAPCGTVTNLGVGSITSTTASLTFTPPTGATSYTITYTPQGGNLAILTPSPTSSPAVLTGLTPSTTYTVTIQATCPSGTGLPLALTLTTAPPPPANDNCAAPTALTVATACAPVTATTVGATASAAPIGAPTCTTGAVNDVWFSLTVPANGIVQVATGAVGGSTVTDTGLQLYSGSCGALTPLGCNDNFGANNFSQVRATGLTPGATVYARVWQVGSAAGGQFTVCATTDPPCPAVTNLAVSGITTTSANVSFTPPTAGTSYTVTYTPAGGSATTVTPNPTASPVALTSLLPGTTYTVSVVSNCLPGETSTAATTTFTTTTCIAPTTLTVSAITTTSATVSFGAGNGTSYTVTYTPAGGSATTVTPNPTGSPVALTGLTPGTTYTVRIVSNCGGGQSPAATATFTTLTPCNPVTGLAATNVTTNSATLTFAPPTGGATYTVTYTSQAGQAVTIVPAPTSSPVQLTGLAPSTTYTVSVTSQCSNGLNSTASTITFTTLAPCNAVTNLAAGSITTTSASLSFTPASTGTSYTVTYTPAGGSATTVTPNPTASPVALTGLLPGTTYTVSVVSNCGAGQTSTAATTTFTTLAPCNPVTNLTAGSITSTSASLTFTPASAGTGYTVTYTPQGGSATTVTPAPTASPVALSGLTPGTQYTVSVVSNCGGGQTSTAATTTFTTAAAPACPPITGLTATGITPNSAQVNFVGAAGNTSYQVSYITTGGSLPVIVTPNPTSSPVTITGLQPNTQYTVCVTSICGSQTSTTPVCLNFLTASLPAVCAAPTNVLVTSVSSTAATVSFTPSASATNYTVTYTPAGGSAQSVGASGSPLTLMGLTPNTPYTVSIVSNCAGGTRSTATANVPFTTVLGTTHSTALAEQVGVYPNPAQQLFWVELPAALTHKAVQATLYNALGQQVQARMLPAAANGLKASFDVTSLPRGMYSLQLSTTEGLLVKRLIVE
ncbi:T9SS type A sorting domain-containing protein [Hymenobacter busanensis]|uniref:T9SS type A sorting domain-containing protein n=1 Tax=Hymenobacter busanensis TaxID=2607656 RepID=A0A7L5A227_9BACT|nr:fibronectin type III domain-containing protein [Hymenobacter busanensis]KAA9338229.1 T9SS type A sorting domain-containing protein [Hymenobacter busanensis]QHJ09347.1 T9SS type A sorting domain-containing protein [Hymenobacter busanensis]